MVGMVKRTIRRGLRKVGKGMGLQEVVAVQDRHAGEIRDLLRVAGERVLDEICANLHGLEAEARDNRRVLDEICANLHGLEAEIRNIRKEVEPSPGTRGPSENAQGSETRPATIRPVLDHLTEEMLRLNDASARGQGVDPAVHPKDFIYWFCTAHPQMPLDHGINYYFRTGGESAAKLAGIVAELGYREVQTVKLLEFASGYGCLSRHFKKYGQFDLTSCDIHPEAIEFLRKDIGVKAVPSAHVPEQFSPPENYDIVFALSFFSHMPKTTFGRWLRALYTALKVPGYLVFTTHGVKSGSDGGWCTPSDIPADGFWFSAHSEQKDLDTAEYGVTLSTPDYVIGEIYRQTGAPIVSYKSGEWWGHQDLWVVRREK
jgi:hypothetical protein